MEINKYFTPCCDTSDIVEQDKFDEPIFCCTECGTWHTTPKELLKDDCNGN